MRSNPTFQTIHSASTRENPQPNDAINTVLGSVAIALPIAFVLGAVGYRWYRTHVVKRQITQLERIWSLSLQDKLMTDD